MLKLCNSVKANVWYLRSLENLAIKMWFPFNFAKNLKNRHFVVGGPKNLKLSTNTCFSVGFQKNVLSSFQLFSSVCYQDDLSDSEINEAASSTARNVNNNWLLHVWYFRNNKPLLEMSTIFIFEIKGVKKNEMLNFFKDCLSVMRRHMNIISGVFQRPMWSF